MRIYGDLAPWFHLLTAPEDYAAEAERYRASILEAVPDARTLLELGSGGGNNASHLRAHFTCTLSDLSPQMLTLSRELNPECEHVLGDMRTLRLGRTFDAVFVHDAVMYLTTEDDLRACMVTAFAHTRRAVSPSSCRTARARRSRPAPITVGTTATTGGRSATSSGRIRPAPGETSFVVDYVVLLSEPGADVRVVHDRHLNGLFPEHTWLYLSNGRVRGEARPRRPATTRTVPRAGLRRGDRPDAP